MQVERKAADNEGRTAVSAEIRALMGRHRVTQTSLAKYLGMSQSALSERLNGRVPWDVDDLSGVAEKFGVEVADLFVTHKADNPRYVSDEAVITLVPYEGQMELDLREPDSDGIVAHPVGLVKAS